MVDSYEMDFMKGNFILVKVDGMHSICKTATHCSFVKKWKGRLNLVRDTAAEKEFDIVIMTLEHVSSEIQENRNGRSN